MIEDPPTSKIPGLGKLSVELLDAVGILLTSQIARANVDVLHLDLAKANKMLLIRKSNPSPKEVAKWIEKARDLTGIDEEEETMELDEVAAGAELPESEEEILVAIPVSGKRLAQQGIKATEVPIMATGGTAPPKKVKTALPPVKSISEPISEPAPEVKESDVVEKVAPLISKKNPLALHEKKPEIAPLESSKKNDPRITASEGLNEGRKLHSRSFIRGVLHPQIGRIRISALVTILMFIMMPVAIVGGGMIMFTKNLWWAAAPAGFVVIFFLYLINAGGAKCRICGQPVFKSKNCRKHVKAHRLFGLGYIIPTSLHMLIFHWFRCIYCGTSVRLKK